MGSIGQGVPVDSSAALAMLWKIVGDGKMEAKEAYENPSCRRCWKYSKLSRSCLANLLRILHVRRVLSAKKLF